MSETRNDAVSERARMLRAEDELSKAIGALPLPWGDSALDAPLARIREAINALAATPPTPDLDAETLAMLDGEANRHTTQFGALPYAKYYAYAAQCVREVAALRAENARLASRAEIVDAMEPLVRAIVEPQGFRARLDNGATFVTPEEIAALRKSLAAYAQATGRTDAEA